MSIKETSYDAMMDNIADKSTGSAGKSNSLSIEELLRPRYKVIADYPESDTPVGTILFQHVFDTGNYIYTDNKHDLLLGHNVKKVHVENYPHLFKKLEWHEERKESEMPEYVKCIETPDQIHFPNMVYKVKWELLWGRDESNVPIVLSTNCYFPATEEEYIQYQQNKNV